MIQRHQSISDRASCPYHSHTCPPCLPGLRAPSHNNAFHFPARPPHNSAAHRNDEFAVDRNLANSRSIFTHALPFPFLSSFLFSFSSLFPLFPDLVGPDGAMGRSRQRRGGATLRERRRPALAGESRRRRNAPRGWRPAAGIMIASAGKAKDPELDGGICELKPTSACRGPGALNRCIGVRALLLSSRAAGGEQVSGFFFYFSLQKFFTIFFSSEFFCFGCKFFLLESFFCFG